MLMVFLVGVAYLYPPLPRLVVLHQLIGIPNAPTLEFVTEPPVFVTVSLGTVERDVEEGAVLMSALVTDDATLSRSFPSCLTLPLLSKPMGQSLW